MTDGSSGRCVAVVGAGVMGEALIAGLARGDRDADELLVSDQFDSRAEEVAAKYQAEAVSNVVAASRAHTIVLVVKPQDMATVLNEIGPHLRPDSLVVSLAAGITTNFLADRLPAGHAVVRVMPNTPALVDEGMAAIAPGPTCDDSHAAEATRLLSSVGRVVTVPEAYLDAVTALSGSGPAYIFYVVEAMIEAGVLLGLPRGMSTDLVVQTLVGSAAMLRETGEHPSVLRENVSSPAGTTVAALRELDRHMVRAAFVSAIEAARDRSAELAGGA